MRPYGPAIEDSKDLRVADFLTSEQTWNIKRIEEELPLLSSQIMALRPSLLVVEDAYIWRPTKDGVFTEKSGYHSIIAPKESNLPISNSEDEFNWIKDIWNGSCSPKIKVFLWSVIQKAIPLGYNLQKRGLLHEAKCIRCGELEIEAHIFFQFPYAIQVWQMLVLYSCSSISCMSGQGSNACQV